jgi:hypothetical protein
MSGEKLFFRGIFVFIAILISISFVSNASASIVVGSLGDVNIIGNDPAHNSGSYKIHVVYSIYDGTSNDDPLGIKTNNEYQIAFKLTHLGSDGETPALGIGRFLVFAPTGTTVSPFYTSISAVSDGNVPSSKRIYPYSSDLNNYARFSFANGTYVANFLSGSTSQTLVLTASKSNLPASVILEIDTTNTVPSISADTTVRLIPEPASMALFGIASLLGLRRRRKI